MYAYNFEGKRYDVGDKLGFLEATVDFALKREELRDDFMEYLKKVSLEEDETEMDDMRGDSIGQKQTKENDKIYSYRNSFNFHINKYINSNKNASIIILASQSIKTGFFCGEIINIK